MRSTITTLIIGIIIVGIIGGGGYLLYTKFKVSADVSSTGNCGQADFNKDSQVNSLDLNMLISAIANNSENPSYDLNSDSKTTNADIDVLTKCWTNTK